MSIPTPNTSGYNYEAILSFTPFGNMQSSNTADIQALLTTYVIGETPPKILNLIHARNAVPPQPTFVVFGSPLEARAFRAQFKSPAWLVESLEHSPVLCTNFDRIANTSPPPSSAPHLGHSPFSSPKPSSVLFSRSSSCPDNRSRPPLGPPSRSAGHSPVPATDMLIKRFLPIRHRRNELPSFELTDTLAGHFARTPRPIDRVLCLTPTFAAAISSINGAPDGYASDLKIRDLLHGCGHIEYISRWRPFKSHTPYPHVFVTFESSQEARDSLKKFMHLDWEIQSLDAKLAAEYSWSLRQDATLATPEVTLVQPPPASRLHNTTQTHSEGGDLVAKSLKAPERLSPSPSSQTPLKYSGNRVHMIRSPPRRPKRPRSLLSSMSHPELEREVMYLEDALDDDSVIWTEKFRKIEDELEGARRWIERHQQASATFSSSEPPSSYVARSRSCTDCYKEKEQMEVIELELQEERSRNAALVMELAEERAKASSYEKQLEDLRLSLEPERKRCEGHEKNLRDSQGPNLQPASRIKGSESDAKLAKGGCSTELLLQTCTDDRRKLWESIACRFVSTPLLPSVSSTARNSAMGGGVGNGALYQLNRSDHKEPSIYPAAGKLKDDGSGSVSMDESDS